MSYGLQIRTNQGLTDVANINVGRYITTRATTSQSGSLTEPLFSDVNGLGHISVITLDGKIAPQISWTESTKTLSWSPLTYSTLITSGQFSSNIRFIFWMFD